MYNGNQQNAFDCEAAYRNLGLQFHHHLMNQIGRQQEESMNFRKEYWEKELKSVLCTSSVIQMEAKSLLTHACVDWTWAESMQQTRQILSRSSRHSPRSKNPSQDTAKWCVCV